MADKKITDLELRDSVSAELSIPSDDGIQTYRVTVAQLKTYFESVLLPPGHVLMFAGATLPDGHLWCNGAAVSRATYAALFTAIGVAHGSGDGSTTFNLPDYRGRFVRGVDTMGGISATRDPDKASRTAMASGGTTGDGVGSVQAEAFKQHTHGVTDPGHSHVVRGSVTGSGSNTHALAPDGPSESTSTVATGITNQNSGGNETRPINAYANFIIKT